MSRIGTRSPNYGFSPVCTTSGSLCWTDAQFGLHKPDAQSTGRQPGILPATGHGRTQLTREDDRAHIRCKNSRHPNNLAWGFARVGKEKRKKNQGKGTSRAQRNPIPLFLTPGSSQPRSAARRSDASIDERAPAQYPVFPAPLPWDSSASLWGSPRTNPPPTPRRCPPCREAPTYFAAETSLPESHPGPSRRSLPTPGRSHFPTDI